MLTIAILLQKSSSIGLGAYSGSNESLFGAKGPAGFLAKFTFFVGALFILNTLALGYTYNESLRGSVTQSEQFKSLVPTAGDENTAPAAPATTNEIPAATPAPSVEINMTEANATNTETNATKE